MPIPQSGDILIRSLLGDRYELVDVISLAPIAGPFDLALTAIAAARARNPRAIWQQNADSRGRPLGDPFRLPG